MLVALLMREIIAGLTIPDNMIDDDELLALECMKQGAVDQKMVDDIVAQCKLDEQKSDEECHDEAMEQVYGDEAPPHCEELDPEHHFQNPL